MKLPLGGNASQAASPLAASVAAGARAESGSIASLDAAIASSFMRAICFMQPSIQDLAKAPCFSTISITDFEAARSFAAATPSSIDRLEKAAISAFSSSIPFMETAADFIIASTEAGLKALMPPKDFAIFSMDWLMFFRASAAKVSKRAGIWVVASMGRLLVNVWRAASGGNSRPGSASRCGRVRRRLRCAASTVSLHRNIPPQELNSSAIRSRIRFQSRGQRVTLISELIVRATHGKAPEQAPYRTGTRAVMRMTGRGRLARLVMAVGLALLALAAMPQGAQAAPYAAYVIDARTGEVLHSRDADRRLHPASLTKMMTLYLAIEAVKEGRLGLDQAVTISRRAAQQPPSKIGLRAGSKVTIRNLLRAAAVKSANDAAVALAEATAGSVDNWARLATAKARMFGMMDTTFKNPHGLTEEGHLSTAHDMALLGRRLFFDHPEYYNLFSRRTTTALGKTIYATNRRLLSDYPGADGIKTGYTRAAGFNLVASAHRGEKHIIAAMFGGRSSADRTRKVSELLDMGFARAPRHAAIIPPAAAGAKTLVAAAPLPATRPSAPKSLLGRAAEALTPTAAAAEATRSPVFVSATRYAPSRAAMPRMRPALEIGTAMQLPPRRP